MSGIFSVVYADPPWQYNDKNCNGAAEQHYMTLNLAAIKALPVASLTADDSVLFLWATLPLLPEALATMHAWGFKYKSCAFTWLKTNPKSGTPFYGLGRWTRGNVELCLLGVKGKPKRQDNSVFSVVTTQDEIIDHPVTRHSAKPAEVRNRIVTLMGDVPRVELFAREESDGWIALGNEIDGIDIRDSLLQWCAE